MQDIEKIKNFFYYIKSKGFKMIHDTPEEFLNSNTFGVYIKKDDIIIKKLIEKIELIKKDIAKGLLNEADFYIKKFGDVSNDYTFYIYKQRDSDVLYMFFDKEGTYHEDWNRSRYGATINN